jgi:hypothetical protein
VGFAPGGKGRLSKSLCSRSFGPPKCLPGVAVHCEFELIEELRGIFPILTWLRVSTLPQ